MNAAHLTIAAGILIPSALATGVVMMPSPSERQASRFREERQAAIQRKAEEETPQRFVLQPFYVPGGAFIVQIEAKGMTGLSQLCSNLPILHDAIITELDANSLLFTKNAGARFKPDPDAFRKAINAGFRRPYVLNVDVKYEADTEVRLAGKRKVGSATRCTALEKTQRRHSHS